MNCHDCKYKKSIPGDAHIRCGRFDKAIESSPEASLIAAFGGIHLGLENLLGMKANPHGVKKGWCNFPFNFDPCWLDGQCKGFDPIQKP